MSEHDQPNLDDVLDVEEQATPDHHAHGKQPKHLNDDELEHRTEQERDEVGAADYVPDEVPSADA
ncbi:hypothetical protein [Jatrophihabitans endophyticus]|uniref:hypothetical protein n=1 Tax=Jatrophihabitans endophyticus TaxID=1206085 RepID=UPI0019D855E7|nr:hypothetical protein [Jatrophihabitans endophyticus]MBE7187442.1 hypothetical protein [Jatrophihabitans endophyticus]